MKYEKQEMGPYNLHIIQTDKFKTVTVQICFRQKLDKESITLRHLLTYALLETTNKYKTPKSHIIAAEDLYNISVNVSNTKNGSDQVMSFTATFLNEKYTETDQYNQCLDYLMDIIFNPNISNNQFQNEAFTRAYDRVKKQIDGIKEDMRSYAQFKNMEVMFKDSPIAYNMEGDLDVLNKVTSVSLYEYYLELLKTNIIDIFILGDIDYAETKHLINDKFKIITIKKPHDDIIITNLKPRMRMQKAIVLENVNQAVLTLGAKAIDLTFNERFYVMRLYNYILGGGVNSKLFLEVREKHSLAYYIHSNFSALTNVLLITSGINAPSFNKCLRLIKKNISDMEQGLFTDQELETARRNLISLYETMFDSPMSIIRMYYNHSLLGLPSNDEQIKALKQVTKEDIMKVSKKIKKDTIVLIRGEQHEKN